MAQKHDVDKGCQFPKEIHALQAKNNGHGIDVCYRYGDGNKCHHPYGFCFHLAHHSLQEG